MVFVSLVRVCGDGRSNWFKGAQLITVYVIIALMFYFMPAAPVSHAPAGAHTSQAAADAGRAM